MFVIGIPSRELVSLDEGNWESGDQTMQQTLL